MSSLENHKTFRFKNVSPAYTVSLKIHLQVRICDIKDRSKSANFRKVPRKSSPRHRNVITTVAFRKYIFSKKRENPEK